MNKINFIKGALAPKKAPQDDKGTVILDLPSWVGYTFGSLFIVLGIAFLLLYPKSKRRADDYKKRQLKKYNEDTNRNITDYNQTRLFLPFWEKVKFSWPIFLGITFIIVGFAWILGNALTTKNF